MGNDKLRGPRLVGGLLLGEVTLRRGGTVNVPLKVIEMLSLEPKPGERSKLLWTPAGEEVIVTKGTPQSDWRKSMFRNNGTVAIPRHIRKALKVKISSKMEEKLLWMRRKNQVIVKKGNSRISP